MAVGINVKDFKFSINDTLNRLQIDATPATPADKLAASILLPGYSVADVGTKLSLGTSTTPDDKSFLFVHGNLPLWL